MPLAGSPNKGVSAFTWLLPTAIPPLSLDLFPAHSREKVMTNKTPIFPMPQPHHFTDYGFDPQIDYFQVHIINYINTQAPAAYINNSLSHFVCQKMKVLEVARKHKRETSSRSIDALHFKLQKPISKDDSKKILKNRKHKQQRWWNRNPLLSLSFFKWNRGSHSDNNTRPTSSHSHSSTTLRPISGPLYFTDSRSSGSTTSRPSSCPIAGTLAPSSKGDLDIPYVSLRELNVDQQHRSSTSALPIYMVTWPAYYFIIIFRDLF